MTETIWLGSGDTGALGNTEYTFIAIAPLVHSDAAWCERVNELRHSLFHLLNCLITTASELWK